MRLPQTVRVVGWLAFAVGAAGAAGPAATASDVRVEGKHLSVIAERMTLGDLLATLEQRGIAKVEIHGDASRIVASDSFEAYDAAQVLRRVLSAHSHILIDRGTSDGRLRFIEVILLDPPSHAGSEGARKSFPSGAAGNRAAASTDESQLESSSETLLYQARSSVSGAERAKAAEALAYRSPAEATAAVYARQVLVEQLLDVDENVRARTLETLKDTADEIPLEAVARMARQDASAERRIQALELLAERADQDARAPLQVALGDPEPAVRERARELIEDWHLDL